MCTLRSLLLLLICSSALTEKPFAAEQGSVEKIKELALSYLSKDPVDDKSSAVALDELRSLLTEEERWGKEEGFYREILKDARGNLRETIAADWARARMANTGSPACVDTTGEPSLAACADNIRKALPAMIPDLKLKIEVIAPPGAGPQLAAEPISISAAYRQSLSSDIQRSSQIVAMLPVQSVDSGKPDAVDLSH